MVAIVADPASRVGHAQTAPVTLAPMASSPALPSVVTVQPISVLPAIDGRLDDEAWQRATRLTQFVQQRPLEGQPASEDTEVLLTYDRDHLYVGLRVDYSREGLIRANRVDRDQIWDDDTIQLLFDPFRDQQRAYVFSVNGYGIQGDTLMAAGAGGGGGAGGSGRGRGGRGGGGGGTSAPGDVSWDALFSSAAVLTDSGWTAELAIPFKSLRYPARGPGEAHDWGFQVQRTIRGKNETAVWAPVTREIPGLLRQLGRLEGLRDLSTSRNLEIQPTVTAVHAGVRDQATGAFPTDHSEEAGINLRYGVTSNLTASFTANPDFSQVESDRPQIETNRRFPLFIPEQRPFFVEGQEAFNVQAPVTVLHTRTILEPRYGAKVTGTLGRALVGLLVADDRAPGAFDPDAPGFGQSARILVGRARYVLEGDSSIGAIFTNREFANAHSRLAGLDGQFRFQDYRVRFAAMAADHRDAEGTARRGNTWRLMFDRRGRSLAYTLDYAVVDPEFRTDLGFVRRTDTRQAQGSVSYTFWPESWVTQWVPLVRLTRTHDATGQLQNNDLLAELTAQFANNIDVTVSVNRDMERFQDINFHTTRASIRGGLNMSRRVALRGEVSTGERVRFVENPFVGEGTNVDLTLDLRPASRVRSEVTLTTSRLVDPRSGAEEFDVRIARAQTTYQFTNRLLVRNITAYNTSDRTFDVNVLGTSRVNAGTAFFLGYDDHYDQSVFLTDPAAGPRTWRRSNRAIFTKLQVLLRY